MPEIMRIFDYQCPSFIFCKVEAGEAPQKLPLKGLGPTPNEIELSRL